MAARILALNREGVGLRLVGGFRFRLLDDSCRMSADLDYHWNANLEAKRDEVVRLLRRQLLPEVRRKLEMDGSVYPSDAPADHSVFVKTAEIAVFKTGSPAGRIEVPVDITRIPCADPPVAVTRDGVVYLAASDADMVESKILAILLRSVTAARDFVDVYLFRDRLPAEAAARLAAKCKELNLTATQLDEAMERVMKHRASLESGIGRVLDEQVEPAVAENLMLAGGAGMIFDHVIRLVDNTTGLARTAS